MSWQARELGIDPQELETERFTHPRQVKAHLDHYKRVDAFYKVPVAVSDTPVDEDDRKTTRL